jgi:hypothetical protein
VLRWLDGLALPIDRRHAHQASFAGRNPPVTAQAVSGAPELPRSRPRARGQVVGFRRLPTSNRPADRPSSQARRRSVMLGSGSARLVQTGVRHRRGARSRSSRGPDKQAPGPIGTPVSADRGCGPGAEDASLPVVAG